MKHLYSLLFLFVLLAPARAQQSTTLWMQGGHTDQVTATIFSPDSRMIISSGLDGQIRFWDPAGSRLLRSIESGSGSVLSIAVSRDGRFLAAGQVDGSVELWDLGTYRVIRTYRGSSPVNSVAISPDGLSVVAGHSSGEIEIWDLDLATVRQRLIGHSYSVNVVAFSNDSRMVASGSDDFSLILWNAETGAQIKAVTQAQFPTTALAFSPDGQRIAATGGGHAVVELAIPSLDETKTPNEHTVTISSIAYSPNGRFIASVSEDYDVPGFILESTVIVSDRQTSKNLFEFKQEFEAGYGTSVAFSPDGRYMVWGTHTGRIRVRELAPEADTAIFTGPMRTLTRHYDDIGAVAFSPAAGILASGADDGTINLWRAGTGVHLRTLKGHEFGVQALDFTRDGRSLASAGTDGSVRIWNVATGAQQSIIYVSPQSPASAVAFSPDGARVVAGTGFGDSTVGIWDTSRIDPIRTFRGHSSQINAVAWGGDGQQVISASDDGTIKVWRASNGTLEMTLDSTAAACTALSLSGNGQILAGGNDIGMVKFWSMPSGDPLSDVRAHTSRINALDLSNDGAFLVTASPDRSVRVFDVSAREELHRYTDHPFEQLAVAVDADSGWVASGATDASVIVRRLVTVSAVRDRSAGAARSILLSATPNPFGDRITFTISPATAGVVDAAIYDMRGERVATIASGYRAAGVSTVVWDAGDIGDGVYLYRIVTSDGVATGTVVRTAGR